MNWKFWQRGEAGASSGGLPKPKDLPEAVGRHLVVDLNLDPDLVWALKAVLRPREESRDMADIRVFNPAKVNAVGVTVRNYATLDGHPELILYEGWFNKKTHQTKITSKSIEKAA